MNIKLEVVGGKYLRLSDELIEHNLDFSFLTDGQDSCFELFNNVLA